jgi:hypothetical protein
MSTEKKNGFHYTARTLTAANSKIADRPATALAGVKKYFEEEFKGLRIPVDCIERAFKICFPAASTQEGLNTDVKNYLLKNLSKM